MKLPQNNGNRITSIVAAKRKISESYSDAWVFDVFLNFGVEFVVLYFYK